VWLHNLDYDLTNLAGMKNHAGYRLNKYLSEDFLKNHSKKEGLIIENGASYEISHLLGSNPKDGSQQVMRMAAFFDRVMMIADHFGIHGAPEKQLINGIRELLFSYDPLLPQEICDAIESATSHHVSVEQETQYHNSFSKMVLSMPKVAHGINCANVCLPSGKWEEVRLPRNTEGSIDEWISEANFYSLVQCSISNVSGDVHRLLNYGSGRKARRWMTGIELKLLNQFSNITIKKAYVPSKITEISALQPMLEHHAPIHELSLAMGFFWQNIWLGLCKQHSPPVYIKKDRLSTNTLTPFIKSLDRNSCFLAAMNLQAHGIVISGYGKGKIHILHDGDNDKLAEACREVRVIPPFLKTNARDDVGFEPLSMFQEFYIQGDFEQLESADKQIVDLICSQ